jgi:hypothetical protein
MRPLGRAALSGPRTGPYSTWSVRGRPSPGHQSPPSGLADGGRLCHLAPASLCRSRNVISRAASLHGHYSASSLLPALPPPSRLRPTSRGRRLYGLPGSVDFATGRGGLLQLLGASWSPCCRSHPAGGVRRVGQIATDPAAFALRLRARPPGFRTSGPPLRSLSLRPGDSLTLPRRAWSMGFRPVGFPPACHPSYGASGCCPGGTDSH